MREQAYAVCHYFQAAWYNFVEWPKLRSTHKRYLCKSCSTALLPETFEMRWVAVWWLTVFLFDGNKTCPRIWLYSLAPWLNCCTVPKTGVFAEEGPENHSPNCIWLAIWFGMCICWSAVPLLGGLNWEGGSFARSLYPTVVYMTFFPNDEIQKLFPGFDGTLSVQYH